MSRAAQVFVILALVFTGGGFAVLHGQSSAAEDSAKAIRELVARWTEAFNQHDTRAISALFSDDATFVNVYGELSRGRSEIEASRTYLHEEHFRELTDAVMSTAIHDIRFPEKDLAIAVIEWVMEVPTLGTATALSTLVLLRSDGEWKIYGVQSTPVRPPEWRQPDGGGPPG